MAWQAGCGRPANSLFVRDALNLDELVPLLAKFEGLVNNFVKKSGVSIEPGSIETRYISAETVLSEVGSVHCAVANWRQHGGQKGGPGEDLLCTWSQKTIKIDRQKMSAARLCGTWEGVVL